MKRFGILIVAGLLAGCAQHSQQSQQPAPSEQGPVPPMPTATAPSESTAAPKPAPSATPTTQPTASPEPTTPAQIPVAAPSTSAPTAKPIDVFELTKDGKTYVFASVEAMTAFNNGTAQPTVIEKPTVSGGTIVIEAATPAQADEIIAGYKKVHPAHK